MKLEKCAEFKSFTLQLNRNKFQDMVSIILAITFLIFSYNEMMPRVSYIKAMDIYLGLFLFLFIPLRRNFNNVEDTLL